MKNKQIIVLTGHTGSGKTTLVNHLKNKDWKIISAGKLFTKLASSYKIPRRRLFIQRFAIQYFRKNGYQEFTNVLLNEIKTNDTKIIFEGIRPLEVINKIKNKYPNSVTIFIDVDKNIRYKRLWKRSKINKAQIETLQEHPIEKNLLEVKSSADYIIENNTTKEKLISKFHKIIN